MSKRSPIWGNAYVNSIVIVLVLSRGNHVRTHVETHVLSAIVWVGWLTRVLIALVHHAHRVVNGLVLLGIRVHATAIQTLVHDLSLVGKLSRIRSLAGHHLLLTILHILKFDIKGERTYLYLLVRPNLRRVRHSLPLILLLRGSQLLVGGRGQTALAEGQQHLGRGGHWHDDGISGTESSTNFLNIRQALGRTAAVGVVAVIFCLHLGVLGLAGWLAVVGVLNGGGLVLIVASGPATL